MPANAAFEGYYLRQVTTEFAEDLDKLRSSADFVVPDDETTAARPKNKPGVTAEDNSLQMLIGALKQGTSTFSAADQARVAQ